VEHGELRQKPGQPAPGTASDSVMSRDTSDSTFYVYVYVRQDKTRQDKARPCKQARQQEAAACWFSQTGQPGTRTLHPSRRRSRPHNSGQQPGKEGESPNRSIRSISPPLTWPGCQGGPVGSCAVHNQGSVRIHLRTLPSRRQAGRLGRTARLAPLYPPRETNSPVVRSTCCMYVHTLQPN
jgi:hypothetical protein